MGDRYFDLGNFSVNNGLSEADDELLLAAYWGEPCTPRRFAAVRLMRVMSDFREGMWGVVQTGISALDFDFAGYADEHLERVAAGMADPRFGGWLEEARGDRS
jgi:thiamine kinase-like enzyme